jgi:hypothetical protein
MKLFRDLIILCVILFVTCVPAFSQIDVNQYLDSVGNVNQTAIEDAINGGADPIKLASELAAAKPELAAAFALAVAAAAPNVDISALMAAVIAAAPDQANHVTIVMQQSFPNAFQATNTFTNTNRDLQNQLTEDQRYQLQLRDRNVSSPSS